MLLNLFLQPAKQSVNNRLAVFFVDSSGQRNIHRAGFDTVLRVAAVGDAVVAHQRFEALIAVHLAGGVGKTRRAPNSGRPSPAHQAVAWPHGDHPRTPEPAPAFTEAKGSGVQALWRSYMLSVNGG